MAATNETTFIYDWQRQGEGFLKWMLPTLISDIDRQTFESLSEATSKWTQVELSIRINGVDVPSGDFVSGIERNMAYYANQEAQRLIAEIPELHRLRELMDEADTTLRLRLTEILANAGIEIDDE